MLIDQLPELNSLNDTDEVPVERGTSTYKAKITAFIGRFVKKTGDTISGSLDFTSTLNPIETPPSSNQFKSIFMVRDADGDELGGVRYRHFSSGSMGACLETAIYYPDAPTSPVFNYLRLFLNHNKEATVSLSHPDAWLKALNLYATTNFPPSSWHSKVSANAGTTKKYGQVVMFSWNLKQTGAVASGSTLATFASGTNFAWAYGVIVKGNSVIGVCHSTSNTIICDVAVPWSSGTEYFTVMLTTSLL